MPSVTRNRRRETLASPEEVLSVNLTVTRVIKTLPSLLAFVEVATLHPSVGTAVELLSVDLLGFQGFPASQLRIALQQMPNVKNLGLKLPLPLPRRLLADIQFSALQHFHTNLPHIYLLPFLAAHDTLVSLRVGMCGKTKTCPLESVRFAQLKDLECTSSCLRAFPYQGVDRLTVRLDDPSASMCAILRGLTMPTLLNYMAIDMFPDDIGVLDEIARVAPQVRTLRLTEKDLVTRRNPAHVIPWGDAALWHKALCALTHMQSFSLTTATQLLPGKPGDETEELAVVLQWAGGESIRGEDTQGLQGVHPQLDHILLFYGVDNPITRTMSFWNKKEGMWIRTNCMSKFDI